MQSHPHLTGHPVPGTRGHWQAQSCMGGASGGQESALNVPHLQGPKKRPSVLQHLVGAARCSAQLRAGVSVGGAGQPPFGISGPGVLYSVSPGWRVWGAACQVAEPGRVGGTSCPGPDGPAGSSVGCVWRGSLAPLRVKRKPKGSRVAREAGWVCDQVCLVSRQGVPRSDGLKPR